MIRTKTVFVIGAGAGFDIGMPLGDKLSRIIGEKLNIKFKSGGYEQASGDHMIMEALRIVAASNKINVNDYLHAGWSVADGVVFSRSIDSYLNAHAGNEKVSVCAKLAIVMTILEAERKSAVFINHASNPLEFQDRAKVLSSWLQPLMFLLQDRVRRDFELENIFQNVKIVNFNYDRCLEQFLWLALQKMFVIDGDRASELMKRLPIIHPYGSIGALSWQEGLRIGFGEMPHPTRLVEASAAIRTFNEQLHQQDDLLKLSEWISEASRLVFLGLHFHDQNMELLQSVEPARGGNVDVLGTGFERSESDLDSIRDQIRRNLTKRGGSWNVRVEAKWDCSGLFREFGTLMSR